MSSPLEFLSVSDQNGTFDCKIGRFYLIPPGKYRIRYNHNDVAYILSPYDMIQSVVRIVDILFIAEYLGYCADVDLKQCFRIRESLIMRDQDFSRCWLALDAPCQKIGEIGDHLSLRISKPRECEVRLFNKLTCKYGKESMWKYHGYGILAKDAIYHELPQEDISMTVGIDNLLVQTPFNLKCISIWPIVRLLWISIMKEDQKYCCMANLPSEIIRYIAKYLKMRSFSDHPFVMKPRDMKDIFEQD